MNNPKLEGSNIIDVIPQTGSCPLNCPSCYYNNNFYRPLDTPLLPTLEDVGDKICRVNSGNDSNNQKELVINSTRKYKHKFFNTSIPNFTGFENNPIVFTCNREENDLPYLGMDVSNLMMVRFRTTMWNIKHCDLAISWYTQLNIPVVITWMRYLDDKDIPLRYRRFYYKNTHILNTYFLLNEYYKRGIMNKYKDIPLVVECKELCKNCGNCEGFYWKFVDKKGG